MISRFSFTDQLSTSERSNKNLLLFLERVKEDTSKDWKAISKELVESNYLLQTDAHKLVQYWKEVYYEQEGDKIVAMMPPKSAKNISDRIWGLCERLWKNVMDKTVGEYFGHLILGSTTFMIVYGLFLADMTNEMFRYFFGIAAAVWASFAFGRRKDEEEKLWGVGITCFALLVGGYWAIKVLAKLF